MVEVKKNKKKISKRKFFPGYLLMDMIVDEVSYWLVRGIPGVTGFLGDTNEDMTYTGMDACNVARLAVGMQSGFVAWPLVAAVMIAGALAHLGPNTSELSHQWGAAASTAFVVLFIASILIIMAGKNSPFLYFQF